MIYRKYIKRILDIVISSISILMISPLLLILAALVRIKLGAPILFRQERTGLYMKRFNIVKFRTMTDERDTDGNLLPDEMRLTKFGNFLRSSSLDELPELFLILAGDLSLIGPRPLIPIYDSYYTEYEKNRFDVRAGLIPPEAMDGVVGITWDEQLRYEAEYALDLSFARDCKILIGVFKTLFFRYGSNHGNEIRTMLSDERRSRISLH